MKYTITFVQTCARIIWIFAITQHLIKT